MNKDLPAAVANLLTDTQPSRGSVVRVHGVLHRALAQAVSWERIWTTRSEGVLGDPIGQLRYFTGVR
jgi:hypothetical protein